MSEEDNVEVEQENPIANMIDYTTNGDFNKANAMFADILGQKVQDALDQEKVAVASSMFGEPEEESDEDFADEAEEEYDDEDFTDEELENAAEDALDDEEWAEEPDEE